jgi:hypothetical protein
VSDVDLAARFFTESITWFAWHRKADAGSAMVDDDKAHPAIRELLCATFLPVGPGTSSRRLVVRRRTPYLAS